MGKGHRPRRCQVSDREATLRDELWRTTSESRKDEIEKELREMKDETR